MMPPRPAVSPRADGLAALARAARSLDLAGLDVQSILDAHTNMFPRWRRRLERVQGWLADHSERLRKRVGAAEGAAERRARRRQSTPHIGPTDG